MLLPASALSGVLLALATESRSVVGGASSVTWTEALGTLRPMLVGLLLVFAFLLGWVNVLRRRVRQKTRELLCELRERRQTEAALKESEERYRLLTEHSHDFVSEISTEGRYLYVNANFQSLLGYSPGEILGKTPLETGMIHPEDRPRLVKTFNRTFLRRSKALLEFRGRSAHGDYRWYECATSCFQASSGEWKVVAISRDITEQKLKDDALRQSHKLESLGLLAGGIAHDFNNLLTALTGHLGKARTQVVMGSAVDTSLDNAEQTAMRAAELCKQLLTYSGKGRYLMHPHNLSRVVEDMSHLIQVSMPKRLRLIRTLDPRLPSIEADAAQLQQVVLNLLTNAAEAIGDRDGTISLTTRSLHLDESRLATLVGAERMSAGTYCLLEVRDSGCGMPPEVMTRIFDPFFTTKPSGRGLGLSAMLGILRSHGAGVSIASEPHQGTTFTLCFPAVSAPCTALPEHSADLPAETSGCILVVDDETLVRESVSGLLEAMGYDVVMASDGEEAVAYVRLEAPRYRLVFMDVTMPRMDGREAFRQIRALCPDLPIILTSGYSEQEAVVDLHGQPATAFLQKPYLGHELRRTVAHMLQQSVHGVAH